MAAKLRCIVGHLGPSPLFHQTYSHFQCLHHWKSIEAKVSLFKYEAFPVCCLIMIPNYFIVCSADFVLDLNTGVIAFKIT